MSRRESSSTHKVVTVEWYDILLGLDFIICLCRLHVFCSQQEQYFIYCDIQETQ